VNASGYSVATGLSGSVSNLRSIENLYGGAGGDVLTGNSGANTIWGNNGIDTIKGGEGNDLLFGGAGTDYMNGGGGNDVLDGYGQPGQPTPIRQFREFDELTGGAGSDTFVLGDKQEAYYRGSGSAKIKDFNKSQDKIQLKGSKYDYNLVEVKQGNITSTGIYHGPTTGVGGDMVALLEGATVTNFNNFTFV
jgi:Ca2+-binding RTX toxin-like protein